MPREEHRLRVFKNRMPRKLFVLKKEGNGRRLEKIDY
jgi:hypothetical protein